MRRNLLEFLFGPTAAQQSTQNLGEDVVKLFEEAADEETEQMVANKKPLATALKAIGISNEVVEGAQWCEIHCDDENQYREHVRLLTDADNMHKLAELGWVFALCGDHAMSNEAPGFKIGFIELNMIGMPENTDKVPALDKVMKDAQKFATTPLDREDDKLNPVETDIKPSDDKQKGVGKPTDGEKPKGKIKDSLSAGDLARRMLDEEGNLQEMTGVSGIPTVESPMGPPIGMPSRIPKRSRFRNKQRLTKADDHGKPYR